MANTSNAFSVLKPGNEVSLGGKKKNKRQRKKANQPAAGDKEAPTTQLGFVEADETDLVPLTCSELEAHVKECKSSEERMGLLNTWRNSISSEKVCLDSEGRPTLFRTILLRSEALEVLTKEVMADPGWSAATEEALGGCLEEALKFTDTEVIAKILVAARKVVSVLSSRGGAIFGAGQRVIGELVVSLKKSNALVESSEENKWNTSKGGQSAKPKSSHRLNEPRTERKPNRGESRSDYDLSIALEELKIKQAELDEIQKEARDEAQVLQSITHGSIISIADLKSLMSSIARELTKDGFNDVPKKKGNKSKKGGEANHGPHIAAMQQYDNEAAALAAQESQLTGEIEALETRLMSLKSQLVAIKEAQLQRRRTPIADSSSHLQRVPLVSPKDQGEVVGIMEEVLSGLEGSPTVTSDEREDVVLTYANAAQKVMECISTKQEEILKNIKFLKDAILRKHEHEEQLMSMAACASKTDLINTNKRQKENLERQMQDGLQVALANLRKAERAFEDVKSRQPFIGNSMQDQLGILLASIRTTHSTIVAESSVKGNVSPPSPVPNQTVKKRFDASKIVKQAEMEVAQEMNRGRRGGQNHTSHAQPKHPQETQPASCIVGFKPERDVSPRVKIPSAEDEMVPAPVNDRMDHHFTPSAIGNGSHSQSAAAAPPHVTPIAPQAINMSGKHAQLVATTQTTLNAPASRTVDAPQAYSSAHRGWKKISPKDGDIDGLSSDPTPAEALQFTKPQK